MPLIVNVMGFTRDEVATLVSAFAERDEVAALELNVSCPNVESGLVMGADPGETEALVARVRPLTAKPLIVKLTPNASDPVRRGPGRASSAGADAVSLINTLRGMALDPGSDRPWLGGGTGGLSGPAVRSIALAQVAPWRARWTVPVVGMGGVQAPAMRARCCRRALRWSASAPRAFATPPPATADRSRTCCRRRLAGPANRLGRRGLIPAPQLRTRKTPVKQTVSGRLRRKSLDLSLS